MSNTFQVKTLSELVRNKYGKKYMKHFEADIVRYVCYHSCGYKPNMHNYFDFDTFDIDDNIAFDYIDVFIRTKNVLYLILCLNSLRKRYVFMTNTHAYNPQLGEPLTAKCKLITTIFKLICDLHREYYFECMLLKYTVFIMLATLHDDYDIREYAEFDLFDNFRLIDEFTTKVLRKYCKNIDETLMLMKIGINNLRKYIFDYDTMQRYIELDASQLCSCEYDSDSC